MDIHTTGFLSRPLYRLFDAVSAAASLLLLSPILCGVALSVLLRDGRPVFFSQIRMGRKGRPFHIWKFRTMRVGCQGLNITAAGDARITRMGSLLRKYKLDELPQLFNVLKGDMSLVGPRPETPEYVSLDAPAWQAILQVRPGITGPATLTYCREEKLLAGSEDPETLYREKLLPAKLLLNLRYLLAKSLWRDIGLVFLTIRYSIFPGQIDPARIERTAGMRASE